MTDTELTKRQEALFQWRDYFLLLREGLEQEPWFSEEYTEKLDTWLQVIITELESDVQHLQCNNERFCRFEEPTDLTQIESNFNCADDGLTEVGSAPLVSDQQRSRTSGEATERFK